MFDYAQLREGLFELIAHLEGSVRDATSKSLKQTRAKLGEEAFNLAVLGKKHAFYCCPEGAGSTLDCICEFHFYCREE